MIDSNSNLARLLKWIHKQMRLRYDFFIVIDGDEGKGKSRGMFLNIMDYWYKKLLQKDIPQECISVDIRNYIHGLKIGEEMDFRGLDEAGDSMDTTDYANKLNKMLYQAYTVIRERRYFSVVVLPSFFDLNPRFRKRRVKMLIHIKRRVNNTCNECKEEFVELVCPKCGSEDFKKGYVCYDVYDRKRLNMILGMNMSRPVKSISVGVKPILSGIVYEYDGEMKDYYAQLKTKKTKDILNILHDEMKDMASPYENKMEIRNGMIKKMSEKMSTTEIADVVGLSSRQIRRIVYDKGQKTTES